MRPGQGKDVHLVLKVLNYFIDRSLCHVDVVVGSGFGGESRPQKKNPKRLVKNINYLKKGHKTLDQVNSEPACMVAFSWLLVLTG